MNHPPIVLGLPLPSGSPWFLALVGVHVAAAIIAVVAGLAAMLSPKTAGRHPRAGNVYYWALMVVCVTMAAVVVYRWPVDNALGALGALAFGSAFLGRRVRRRAKRGWQCVHIPSMAFSYITMLTAFYVDNGPHLPFWNRLPVIALWLLPGSLGFPLLGLVWWKHCRRAGGVLESQ